MLVMEATEERTGIACAIERAGGVGALAAALDETPQTVNNWRARRRAPVRRSKAIEALTGVSVRLLRPSDWANYWPDAPEAAATPATPAAAAQEAA